MLVYMMELLVLLSGMGCYYMGWRVSIRDGVLVNGMGC